LNLRPIYVAFVFANNGYEIYVHQPSYWDAPKLIATIIRGTGTHPATGYSFCVDKNNPDNTLGFFGLCNSFNAAGYVNNYIIVDNVEKKVKISSLNLNTTIGGIISQSGAVYVQFPTISPKWYTLAEVAAESTQFTGQYAYPVNVKLSGDAMLNHPMYVDEVDGI
jgi:hypothetical protein